MVFPSEPEISGQLSDMEWKDKGNDFFKEGLFDDAIKCYTESILINDMDPVYFTNRAVCNAKLGNWFAVLGDCESAIILGDNVKGRYYLGVAYAQLGKYDDALPQLRIARIMSKESPTIYSHMIDEQIRKALEGRERNKRVVENDADRKCLKYALQSVNRSIDREIQEIRSKKLHIEEEEIYQIIELSNNRELYTDILQDAFHEAISEVDSVPKQLCGPLNKKLLQDPVVTPKGITYDREEIINHIKDIGPFDPIGGGYLCEADLIPNMAMKDVIKNYVRKKYGSEYKLYNDETPE